MSSQAAATRARDACGQNLRHVGAACTPVPAGCVARSSARKAFDGASRASVRLAFGVLPAVQGLASTRCGGRIVPSHAVQLHCALPLKCWFATPVMCGVGRVPTVGSVGFPSHGVLFVSEPVVCAVRPAFESALALCAHVRRAGAGVRCSCLHRLLGPEGCVVVLC